MKNHIMQTISVVIFLITSNSTFSSTLDGNTKSDSTTTPNIVFVVVDDMRADEWSSGGHAYLKTPNMDRLANEGASFTSAYHATPLCSPNRASLLTGQYASRHGIIDNTARNFASHRLGLFPKQLQAAGYRTAHIGKWHMGNDPTPRSGYDYWVGFEGQGRSKNPILFENGKLQEVKGYMTDILSDRAVEFINREAGKPFFVYIGHKAVHPDTKQLDDASSDLDYGRRYVPAERHQGKYNNKVVKRRPNHGISQQDMQGKPVLKNSLDFKREMVNKNAKLKSIVPVDDVPEENIRRRAEMILAVDEGLGRITRALEENKLLDNTLIILTSDNGFFYGEHGLTIERRLPYEEAIRAPLAMRYPKVIEPGTIIDDFSSSVDIAPTILDLAGVEIPKTIQGVSLKPLFSEGGKAPRDSILVEYHAHENPMSWVLNMDYRLIRKGDYKYVQWLRQDKQAELYNLAKDPYEKNNLAGESNMAEVEKRLKDELASMVLKSMGF